MDLIRWIFRRKKRYTPFAWERTSPSLSTSISSFGEEGERQQAHERHLSPKDEPAIHFTCLTEHETQPLPIPGSMAFQSYLQHHQLSLLEVARASEVRYLTAWNIAHGIPVQCLYASMVRTGLHRLTGVPFAATIAVMASSSEEANARKNG